MVEKIPLLKISEIEQEIGKIEKQNVIVLLLSIIIGGLLIFIPFTKYQIPPFKEFYSFFLVLVIVIVFTFYYSKKHKSIILKIKRHKHN